MSDCNRDCGCAGIPYYPVCSNQDGYTNYFSPCHAGCKTFEEFNDTVIFRECACLKSADVADLPPPALIVTSSLGSRSDVSINSTVTSGVCPENCQNTFYLLLGFLFFFSLIGSTTRVPNFLLTLRSIELRDKSASITFSISFLSLFAFLPSPIVYGAVLDTTCKLWDTTKCGETTHCLIYDTDAMRYYLSFLPAGFIFLAFLCDLCVFYYAKGLTIYESDEEIQTTEVDSTAVQHEMKDVNQSNPTIK